MKLTVALKMSLLVQPVKSDLPSNGFLPTKISFSANILALILFNLLKRVWFELENLCNWEKNELFVLYCFHNYTKVLQDLENCLNLWSFKRIKPILKLVRNFSPNRFFTLKTLLEFGWMKFNTCFLKTSKETKLQISRSNLFH